MFFELLFLLTSLCYSTNTNQLIQKEKPDCNCSKLWFLLVKSAFVSLWKKTAFQMNIRSYWSKDDTFFFLNCLSVMLSSKAAACATYTVHHVLYVAYTECSWTYFFWPYSLWKQAGFVWFLSSAVQSFCSGSEGQKVMPIINNWRRKNITLASWLMSQSIELASTETVERKVIKTSKMKAGNHIFEKKGFSVIPAGLPGCSEQKNGVSHQQCWCTLFLNRSF